jgi:23S rRNA pseudouridine2605 synthase
MAERLQKILAAAGVASRRSAEALIRGGRVTVNGKLVTELGTRADPLADEIRVDGERVRRAAPIYLVLHKPDGVMTTLEDPERRPTVRDLLPHGLDRVFPVGRLDFHSTGILLLTNDGELTARLLHPSARIPRTYRVKVNGRPDERALARLRKGVRLDDGVTGPAQVDVEESRSAKTWLRITIREGKRREVRRMCDAVGHRVDRLVRVRFGPLEIGSMRPGQWRFLDPDEIEALRIASGLIAEPRRERQRRARKSPRRASWAKRASRRS